jgi:hypothetical protein
LRGMGQGKVVGATCVCRNVTQKIFTHTNGTKSYRHDAGIKMCIQAVIFAVCNQGHIQPIHLPQSVSCLCTGNII